MAISLCVVALASIYLLSWVSHGFVGVANGLNLIAVWIGTVSGYQVEKERTRLEEQIMRDVDFSRPLQ
jgi:hypothetical protein